MKYAKLFLVLFSSIVVTKSMAGTYDAESEEVKIIINSSTESRYNYCIANTMTCRTLVLLTSKSTGDVMPMFYNNFFSSERAVALSGFFLKNADGTFRSYSDANFDGKVIIDTVRDTDKAIEATFDTQGFPTLHNLRLTVLGTTKYSIVNLSYSEEESRIDGTQYDTADASYSQPVQIVYKRIRNP